MGEKEFDGGKRGRGIGECPSGIKGWGSGRGTGELHKVCRRNFDKRDRESVNALEQGNEEFEKTL